jgi:integrase
MASIIKRKYKKGVRYRVQIRRVDYPIQVQTFSSKADADAWARQVEGEMDRGVWFNRVEAEATILKAALERYLNEVTPAKKGAKRERNRIKAWQRHPLAAKTLASIRGSDIAAYRDQRLKDGASPSTVTSDLIVLSHLFTIAKKEWGMEGLVNPVSLIRRPKLPRGRDRRLLPGEEERLLQAAKYPMREMIILAIDTAMRAGELLSLRWENIDLKVRIAKLLDTKNGEERTVPLTIRAVQTLSSMPRRIDGFVLPQIGNDHVSHRFQAVCRRVGVKGLRFHDLRHCATSRLFEQGLNIMEVSAITGHKTLTMLKRYTHLRAEDLVHRLDG